MTMKTAANWLLPALRRAPEPMQQRLTKDERRRVQALIEANERYILGEPEKGDLQLLNRNRAKHGMPPL